MAKGLPDIDSLANYGGALNNFGAVVDPTTDEDVKYRNLYAMNVAMMTHTAARGFVTLVGANPPTDPNTGFVHDALWGSTGLVKPTVAHAGAGHYTITLPATITDDLAVAHTIALRRAFAQVECTATLYHATAQVSSANTIEVRTWLANGTADDLSGQNITCWYW